jgi:hypothetical protein
MAREEDDGQTSLGSAQGILQDQGILPSEPYIQDDAGWPIGELAIEERSAGCVGFDLHAH